jgi:hypothetical protein
VHSSPPDQTTSGTESTPTNEPEAPVTPRSETLVAELDEVESAGSPPPPPANSRRFTMIVTGTIPGTDLEEERAVVLRTMERALGGLSVTYGIELIAAAYRSDPMDPSPPPSNESAPTGTAPDATDTSEPTKDGGDSDTDSSSDGSSDSSDSNTEASESASHDTPQ